MALYGSSDEQSTNAVANKSITNSDRINNIVSDLGSQLTAGTLSYGTSKCVDDGSSPDCNVPDNKMDEVKQQCVSLGGTIQYFTVAGNSVYSGCNFPMKYELVSFEKSKYSFYDYIIKVRLDIDVKFTKSLDSYHLYAPNYTASGVGDGGATPNNAQLVGNIQTYKIKLENINDLTDNKYTIVPDK